jgi:hypothetical protein
MFITGTGYNAFELLRGQKQSLGLLLACGMFSTIWLQFTSLKQNIHGKKFFI